MDRPIRWGILGAGKIARKFAADLPRVPGAELVAVGSQSEARARVFAAECGVPRHYGSYEGLLRETPVDVVYVATRNPAHQSVSRMALQAGKAVLCEKPFAINAGEAAATIELARERRLFLMEAMWTRCFPAMLAARDWVARGEIGELRMLQADFGFRAAGDSVERLFSPALGGGSLLDVGVYPIALAVDFLGHPTNQVSLAHLGSTGVDEHLSAVLSFAHGRAAVLSASITFATATEAWLFGTDGRVHLPSPWWKPHTVALHRDGRDSEALRFPYEGFGYQHEIEEVMRCLRAGEIESDRMPWHDTLVIAQTMDALRAQWGLRYPMETDPTAA